MRYRCSCCDIGTVYWHEGWEDEYCCLDASWVCDTCDEDYGSYSLPVVDLEEMDECS